MPSSRWSKPLVEAVVIVGSILLAFGIEAWWDERGERVREQEAIARLIDEFEAVDAELVRIGEVWRGDRDADETNDVDVPGGMQMLERTLRAVGTEVPEDEADAMLAGMLGVGGAVRLPEGVLSALLSSGELSLIRSDSLRVALAEWGAYKRVVESDGGDLRTLVNDRIIPYLWQRIPLRTVDVRTGFHEELGVSPFPYDPKELFRDPYFENLANEKLIQFETSLSRLAAARAHVGEILRLLAASRTAP